MFKRKLAISALCILCSHSMIAWSQEKDKAVEKASTPKIQSDQEIDFNVAKQYLRKRQSGATLTKDEDDYLRRAMELRRSGTEKRKDGQARLQPRESVGFKPLNEMLPSDRYKGQEGGLYGNGSNQPPEAHQRAAERELSKIVPLNADGQPSADGYIAFVSLSMSNATMEYSTFKKLADADAEKGQHVMIVDLAQGGQAMAEWVDPHASAWREADRRLVTAKVSPKQVQVAWIKLANKGPSGDLEEHGRKLYRDTLALIRNAKDRFPNLRIAYLSSRIYGGYATGALNPEPYAYESAFPVRWLLQDQIKGEAKLNFDESKGAVKAPLLLWGPYLWADGMTPRKNDQLVYRREDFANDGTHPSHSGREKVAGLMLDFYKSNPLAKSWFAK